MTSRNTLILMALIAHVSFLKAMDESQTYTERDLKLMFSQKAWDEEEQWAKEYKKIPIQKQNEAKARLTPEKDRIMEHFKTMGGVQITALTDDAIWEILGYDPQAPNPPTVYNDLFTIIHLIYNDQALTQELFDRLSPFNRKYVWDNIPREPDNENIIRYRKYLDLAVKRLDWHCERDLSGNKRKANSDDE